MKNILKSLGPWIAIILLIVLVDSCQEKSSVADNIKYLNGFWEVEQVIMQDGTVRDYNHSRTIDYIEVDGEGKQAERRKVVPQPSGALAGTTSSQEFIIAVEEDSLRLYYSNEFDSWKETVINVDADEFRVRGKHGRVFIYKRRDF